MTEQPQDWTPTDVLRIWQGERTPKNDHEGMQRVADAHNAEREKLKAIIQTHAEAYGKACAALATEQRERDNVEALSRACFKQLAAERKKFKEMCDAYAESHEILKKERDAEREKVELLVEALEDCVSTYHGKDKVVTQERIEAWDAVLAKVKDIGKIKKIK
jgi:hypothetical protein